MNINHSTIYYQSKGESRENLEIMQEVDKPILEESTAGILTMQTMLKDKGKDRIRACPAANAACKHAPHLSPQTLNQVDDSDSASK